MLKTGFNTLLRGAGLDPKTVKLVRHEDPQADPPLWDLWLADPQTFDEYQRLQSDEYFKNAEYIASFIHARGIGEVFIGLYLIGAARVAPSNMRDPYRNAHWPIMYELTLTHYLLEYRGRLLVEWVGGKRRLGQWAEQKKKEKNLPVLKMLSPVMSLPDRAINYQISEPEHGLHGDTGFDPFDVSDGRSRALRSIVERRGQTAFRDALLNAYSRRCAVTDCDVPEALEAAHIVAYRGVHTDHVANGLLLRADIHTLFDLNLIGFDPDTLQVHVAACIAQSAFGRQLTQLRLRKPSVANCTPNPDALRSRLICLR